MEWRGTAVAAWCVVCSCDSAEVVCPSGQVELASGECVEVTDGAAPTMDAESREAGEGDGDARDRDVPASDAGGAVDAGPPDARPDAGPMCLEGEECGADWCSPGVCSASGACEDVAPRACDDGLDCTFDACDGALRACAHDGSTCTCRLDRDVTPVTFAEPVALSLVVRAGGWGLAWTNGLSSSSRRARVARLAPDGTRLDDVDLGAAPGGVALAADGADVIAAVANDAGVALHRLSGSGVLDPMPATVSTAAAQAVAIASRADGFDVALLADETVHLLAVGGDGTVAGDVVVGTSALGNDPRIEIARGERRKAVVWVAQRDPTEWPTVSIAILDDDGTVVRPGATLLASDPDLAIVDGAAVSFDGSAFVVTWVEDVILGYDADDQPISGGARLRVQRVASDGTEMGEPVTVAQTTDPRVHYRGPSAVWTGRDHRVAWEDEDATRFVRLAATGATLGSPIDLSTNPEPIGWPRLAGSGERSAVVMVRDRSDIQLREVMCP